MGAIGLTSEVEAEGGAQTCRVKAVLEAHLDLPAPDSTGFLAYSFRSSPAPSQYTASASCPLSPSATDMSKFEFFYLPA